MKRSAAALPMLLVLTSIPTSGQVTGGQAPSAERPDTAKQVVDIDIKSPLLVQVSLLPKPGGLALPKRPFDATQTFKETRQYVCDKARVEYVTVVKRKASHDRVRLLIATKLSTDWFAQRVDLTLGLYDGEQQIKSQAWSRVRIGHENFASAIGVFGTSSSKTKELEVELSQAELEELFAEGHAPAVKVLVAINDD
jgi:hypothetical protein